MKQARSPDAFPKLYLAVSCARAVAARIAEAPPDDAQLLVGVVCDLLEEAEAEAEAVDCQKVRGGC
jgi:hypothetical protein